MSHLIHDQAGQAVVHNQRAWLHGPTAHFLRHLMEMVLAMMIGMMVLGLPVRAVAAVMGYPDGLRPFPELSAFAMTFEMTLPMAAWMLYRGHRMAIVGEMSGAMIAPSLAVVALCLVHVLPGASAPGLAHVVMYPAMVGVMLYRKTEYTAAHSSMGHSPTSADHAGHGGSGQPA